MRARSFSLSRWLRKGRVGEDPPELNKGAESPDISEKHAIIDDPPTFWAWGGDQIPAAKDALPCSLVISWVFNELALLEVEPAQKADVRKSAPAVSAAARDRLRAERKSQYTVFAKVLLKCWAVNHEEFPQTFCDRVWAEVSGTPRGAGARTPESVIFLEEFLAGKEFGIARGVTQDGLCGQKLLPVLFRVSTAKAQRLLGAVDTMYWALLCPIVAGQPRSQFYPAWVEGEVYREMRDKRLRTELEKILKRYMDEANRTIEGRQAEADKRRVLKAKMDAQKHRPWK